MPFLIFLAVLILWPVLLVLGGLLGWASVTILSWVFTFPDWEQTRAIGIVLGAFFLTHIGTALKD